jgi:hypothetical protein
VVRLEADEESEANGEGLNGDVADASGDAADAAAESGDGGAPSEE